jgi:hypothetical protein
MPSRARGSRALAPDELSLDDRERQPTVLKAYRDRFSGDATTETHDVKLLGQVPYLRDPPSKAGHYEGC